MIIVIQILFVILLCIICVASTTATTARDTALIINEIKECLAREKHKQTKRYKKTPDGTTFYLDYGDNAFEVLNSLSVYDLKEVETVAKCIELSDNLSQMVVKKQQHDEMHLDHLQYAGSNITYMTGILQAVAPTTLNKILSGISGGRTYSNWKTDYAVEQLGIRSIMFLSNEHVKRMKTKSELAAIHSLKREKMKTFTIGGDQGKEIPEEERPDDLNADEFVYDYLMTDTDSMYTLFIPINDRSKYDGCNFLVKKHHHHSNSEGKVDEEYDDDDDDDEKEEEEEEEEEVLVDENSAKEPAKKAAATTVSRPKYCPIASKIARYAPDRGGFIVVQSDTPHGIHSLLQGKFLCLVIEFWAHSDGSVGDRRTPIDRAKPLQGAVDIENEL